ncbi:MarR family transcriptional regulator [Bacterioplanes sanyensis]|uniref:MarR family transcriptional regulator n=1 Tax=Bacterioplanes sanyensis TaxID=1249553 RepID=A0A222FPL1_9GAMM|nr:MarR family transcriptional regulator [Bacterioplanes sanyensis]ASP40454.1 MarR family transcriptional regulator [Bacterioplanes sanyensis]
MKDHVDTILEQWQRERPDIDCSPVGPIGRLSRLSQHIGQSISAHHKSLGLSSGEFDVLATLRRSGAPYRLTPTALFQSAMLSSGAMTNRLNRLESAGHIRRVADTEDRRSLLVELTEKGLGLIDEVFAAHVENERQLLAEVPQQQLQQLDEILRGWLSRLES